jgi:hypothetical protein
LCLIAFVLGAGFVYWAFPKLDDNTAWFFPIIGVLCGMVFGLLPLLASILGSYRERSRGWRRTETAYYSQLRAHEAAAEKYRKGMAVINHAEIANARAQEYLKTRVEALLRPA